MSEQKFNETHHRDRAGKIIAWILAAIIIVVAAVGLSWNESSKTAKRIVKTEAVIDSLSNEIAWRQKVLARHDSLQTIVADARNFRKLPQKIRQDISAELEKTTPKITSTQHNIEIFEKLLSTEKENLAKLQQNKFYQIYH